MKGDYLKPMLKQIAQRMNARKRIAVVHNVPIACNRATADFVLSSPLMETEYIRQVWDYGTTREMH
jgi:methylglyoxal synthase